MYNSGQPISTTTSFEAFLQEHWTEYLIILAKDTSVAQPFSQSYHMYPNTLQYMVQLLPVTLIPRIPQIQKILARSLAPGRYSQQAKRQNHSTRISQTAKLPSDMRLKPHTLRHSESVSGTLTLTSVRPSFHQPSTSPNPNQLQITHDVFSHTPDSECCSPHWLYRNSSTQNLAQT